MALMGSSKPADRRWAVPPPKPDERARPVSDTRFREAETRLRDIVDRWRPCADTQDQNRNRPGPRASPFPALEQLSVTVEN